MSYAIVINLDYTSFHYEDCNFVWSAIKDNMLEAGFILDKRLLVTKQAEDDACETARCVIEELNQSKGLLGIDIYSYMKEFYGYDHSDAVNLLLPTKESFIVELQ